jgi:hypothetical protein
VVVVIDYQWTWACSLCDLRIAHPSSDVLLVMIDFHGNEHEEDALEGLEAMLRD